jgi:hypothetical protein
MDIRIRTFAFRPVILILLRPARMRISNYGYLYDNLCREDIINIDDISRHTLSHC